MNPEAIVVFRPTVGIGRAVCMPSEAFILAAQQH
jgi:hypothetical protein